jgi:hypothetical protein
MTEQEIIARNVAQWKKNKEAREQTVKKVNKPTKKQGKKKGFKKPRSERTEVRYNGVAFDAIKTALEDAIKMGGE